MNKLVIIRGVAGSGKSSVAEELRKHFPKKTAVIHTEMFYWGIVQGDSPEVVMENVSRLVDNYLKNKYSVIVEGTLSFRDKRGDLYVNVFERLAKRYGVKTSVIFFDTALGELKKREKKRKKISLERLKKLRKIALESKGEDDFVVDTTNKNIGKVVKEVLLCVGGKRK